MKHNNLAQELLKAHSIISPQVTKRELEIIIELLRSVIEDETPGDVVEFGCYEGTTSLFIQRVLNYCKSSKRFHVYDSFAGLPKKSTQDHSLVGVAFVEGELFATKTKLINNFKKAGLKVPLVHKGWFSEVLPSDIPEKISFAFLDGDYYESIRDSINKIQGRLASGSIVVVDDYNSEHLPGAKKATDEWLRSKHYQLRVEASLAIIRVT